VNKKLATFTLIVGLLAISGMAAASEHDLEPDDREDTVFNFGYDEVNKVFVWGTSPSDDTFDCTLENGPIDVTYGSSEDGVIQVPLLEREGGVVSFPTLPDVEPADSVDYSGSDGECGVSGVSVPGPNGQVNHGMFMKAINSVYEGKGRGCINRFIAGSHLGKGDQQIQVPEADADSPELIDGAIDFNTVLADCQHGNDGGLTGQEKAAAKKAAAAEKERGNSHSAPGRSDSSPGKSGPAQSNPDRAPGKSGSAPGHNK
jgi:hypothetical protein